jgi:hypothetical protein
MKRLTHKVHYSVIGLVTLDQESNLRNITRHAMTAMLIEIE